MYDRTAIETFAAHQIRTHHGKYSVDIARDREIARKVLGREPREDDRYVGFIRCEECGELLLDGREWNEYPS